MTITVLLLWIMCFKIKLFEKDVFNNLHSSLSLSLVEEEKFGVKARFVRKTATQVS